MKSTIFKLGEDIECIDPEDCFLTKGKIYTVTDFSCQGYPYVKNDHKQNLWYRNERFKKTTAI